MARCKKQSTAEDLMDLTALAPWWAGAILAVVSYVGLHAYAGRPVVLQPGQTAGLVTAVIWQGLATGGQYLLPLIFLAGAALSAFRRHRASQLHASAASRDDGMARMAWSEFEVLVGEYFRRQGFTAVDNGGGGPDGGVDVLLKKGADRYLVQCKHWRALRVGVQLVRELYGVMAAQRVAGGFVVTSGEFTPEARSFAAGREIELINGKTLQRGVRAQAAASGSPVSTSSKADKPPSPALVAKDEPSCPLCNATMVLRQARHGATPGKQFWGCGRFGQTKCRGTRELT